MIDFKPQNEAIDFQPIDFQPEIAPAKQPNLLQKAGKFAQDFSVGVAKGELQTGRNILKAANWFGEQTGGRLANIALGRGNVAGVGGPTGQNPEWMQGPTPEVLQPQGTAENIGMFTERVAEFLAPSKALAGLTAKADSLAFGAAPVLKSTARMATKMSIQGASGGLQTLAQTGEEDKAKTTAIVSALFPLASAAVTGFAKKITTTVIRPSAADIKDVSAPGKDAVKKFTNDVYKYNLAGSLNDTAEKSANKLNELSDKLKIVLNNSDETVNLNTVYERVKAKLFGKASLFGQVGSTNKAVEDLGVEIGHYSREVVGDESGVISLFEATQAKRGAGLKGAWMYGAPDRDSQSLERVYSAFYTELKKEIERLGGPEVQKLNSQMSDIIPILNATVRRIPVADRNNVLSLTDNMGLYAAVFNPQALGLIGARYLTTSGKFANFLYNASNNYFKGAPSAIIKTGVSGQTGQ